MALQKDRTRINVKGGGTFEISTDDGTTWNDMGYLAESHIVDEIEVHDQNDETGDYVVALDGNRKVTFETTLMQTTKEEIDVIRNNRFSVIKARYRVRLKNNQWQLWSLGDCQIVSPVDLTFNASPRHMGLQLVLLKGSTTGKYYDVAETSNDPPQASDWPDVS